MKRCQHFMIHWARLFLTSSSRGGFRSYLYSFAIKGRIAIHWRCSVRNFWVKRRNLKDLMKFPWKLVIPHSWPTSQFNSGAYLVTVSPSLHFEPPLRSHAPLHPFVVERSSSTGPPHRWPPQKVETGASLQRLSVCLARDFPLFLNRSETGHQFRERALGGLAWP